MRKTGLLTLCAILQCLALASLGAQARAEALPLASYGVSPYRIVIAEDATALEKRAAAELQHFLKEITQADLPIVTDRPATNDALLSPREIILGNNRHLAALDTKIDFEKLGKEGFTIRTVGDHLIIAAAKPRGALYGVYTFLEEQLGCRWYSRAVSRIPKRSVVELGAIDTTQVPVFEWRETYYYDPMDFELAARQKLNGNASTTKDGKITRERHAGWGTWCHTSFGYVPPGKYYDEHPEYYALIGDRRRTSQLCYTNPDLFDIVVAKIEDMKIHPVDFVRADGLVPRTEWPFWADEDIIYWDISQMDTGGNCQCPNCREIDEREGTPMGSLLTFINQVARHYPNQKIATLAYQYTRKPPKNLRPEPNVAIVLCNIECSRGKALATSDLGSDLGFRSDLQNWSQYCEHLIIYDYVVSFPHLVSPFPNLRVLQPNVQFFAENNTKGVFEQGNREYGGEFCELRNYLLAKLLWNPDCDVDAVMDDFLGGFYGPAALPLRRYIDLMHDALEEAGGVLYYGDPPMKHSKGFLASDLIDKYDALFDRAEALTAYDPELLLRVQTARMPLMYAKLDVGHGTYDSRIATAERFFDLADRTGLKMLDEWNMSVERFEEITDKRLKDSRRVEIEPPSGTFHGSVTLDMTPYEPNAQTRYTLDGSEPTATSLLYTAPVELTHSATVKARAFLDGGPIGYESQATYMKAKRLFETEVMTAGDPAVRIDVPLEGPGKLILLMDGGDSVGNDHGSWAEAQLVGKDGKALRLSEIKPLSVKHGWTRDGEHGKLIVDKSVMGDKIEIAKRRFEFGLGAHANSEMVFELDGSWERLQAWVGVDAGGNESSSLQFRVELEEK